MSALFGLTRVHLCIVLLLILIVPSVDANISDILLEQKKAVVTVYVNDENGKHIASGGGFIIDPNGVIVTNCQVIEKWFEKVENTLGAQMEGGIYLPIEDLISSKCKNNLAMFNVEAKRLPAVKLTAVYMPKQGESIVAMVGPLGKTVISEGIIKSVRRRDKLIQTSIPVAPEMSGNPVFNLKGEAIGAAIFLPKKAKNLNFAVPLKDIAKQLDKYRKLAKIDVPPSVPALSPKPLAESNTEHFKPKKKAGGRTDDANVYFLRGCAYHELNMYKEAIKLYKQSLKIKPDFVEAYINLGVAYYKLGKYIDAIDAYKQAIRIKPNSLLIYNKLGAAYIINGEYSMARETLKKATDIAPGNAIAHFNLGIAYFLAGETDAAFKEYTILKDLDKERADILFELIYN